MKNYSPIKRASSCFAGAVLLAMATSSADAATALNGHIALRPLTPQEIKDYKLTGAQGASGLDNIGLGQPAYLEALVAIAVPSADITNVSWTLSQAPLGSTAALAASPLGADLPTYKMVDRLDYQVAGRMMLRPDLAGQYKVVATVQTASNGDATLEQVINAGTYMGVSYCAYCHSGGQGGAPNMVTPWSQTGHAMLFTEGINGVASDHYGANCISCHTVGYDTAVTATNGGFDDMAKQLGWKFPATLSPTNWAAMPAQLQNLANIQCENCHGPGSQHAYSLGGTAADRKISVTFAAGDCAQCHDSKNNHIKTSEWNNSRHAIAVEETEAGCSRCHSARGFANYTAGATAVATEYEVITCSACHDPHDVTNPHQVRTSAPVKLMDNKTVITEGGAGLLCMNCHMSRRDATNYVEVTAGSSRFGPHHGPQADMLAGANAVNYGKVIPSSAHKDVVEDSCATCHMQAGVAATNAAFTKVGGHTFKIALEASGTNAAVELTDACKNCHGDIEGLNFTRQDYDGNGVVEGVQTEVKGLLNKLALMLPPVGTPKALGALSIDKNWTKPQLKAAYNYLFVWEDGSYGVHNLSYAVGLLKASIADLTGDANNDTLPDSWQIQYFGSANDPKAAPNATPAGDGVPNWIKYTLGLDPTVPGMVLPNGVVWANGKGLVNPPSPADDTLMIYTAAEIVFKTEAGKSYQIWGSSSITGGWEKIGAPISGTGSPISYVAPTREGTQLFYRVDHTP